MHDTVLNEKTDIDPARIVADEILFSAYSRGKVKASFAGAGFFD
jgi:hypothetical protein